MRRDEKFALVGLFGVVLSLVLATLAYRTITSFSASFRHEFAAHLTREDTTDAEQAKTYADFRAAQQRHLDVLQQELKDLRRDVGGLLLRKFPAEVDPSIQGHRHEQRIGALEYAIRGAKP